MENKTSDSLLNAKYRERKDSILRSFKQQNKENAKYSAGYVYSVAKDCYPYFDNDEKAAFFNDLYDVSKEFIEETLNIIEERQNTGEKLFYYELERLVVGKDVRTKLIWFLRYAFLSNKFSSDFFETLLTNGECPIEAKSITKSFNKEELES